MGGASPSDEVSEFRISPGSALPAPPLRDPDPPRSALAALRCLSDAPSLSSADALPRGLEVVGTGGEIGSSRYTAWHSVVL